MARYKYVQYTPIGPLNVLGRIDATVISNTPPNHANQLELAENTETTGYQVDIVLLGLVAI